MGSATEAGVILQEILAEMGSAEVIEDARLAEMFGKHNANFFKGRLLPPTFACGKHQGQFAVYVPAPYRAVVFHPRTLEQNDRWVADTLLHEMIHMALDNGKMDTDKEHGPRFTAEANRIGRFLGLKPIAPRTDAAIEWPQSVRRKGYAAWR